MPWLRLAFTGSLSTSRLEPFLSFPFHMIWWEDRFGMIRDVERWLQLYLLISNWLQESIECVFVRFSIGSVLIDQKHLGVVSCLFCVFDTLQRSNFWQSLRTLMFDRRFHKNCASTPSADTHKNCRTQNPITVLAIIFAWDLFLFYRHISSGDGESSDSVLWLF